MPSANMLKIILNKTVLDIVVEISLTLVKIQDVLKALDKS